MTTQTKSKWPRKVPVLKASDICKGRLSGPNGTHCLIGWVYETFNDYSARMKVRDEIKVEIEVAGYGQTSNIENFNDDKETPKKHIALVWNSAMKSLGYTEIHDVK